MGWGEARDSQLSEEQIAAVRARANRKQSRGYFSRKTPLTAREQALQDRAKARIAEERKRERAEAKASKRKRKPKSPKVNRLKPSAYVLQVDANGNATKVAPAVQSPANGGRPTRDCQGHLDARPKGGIVPAWMVKAIQGMSETPGDAKKAVPVQARKPVKVRAKRAKQKRKKARRNHW